MQYIILFIVNEILTVRNPSSLVDATQVRVVIRRILVFSETDISAVFFPISISDSYSAHIIQHQAELKPSKKSVNTNSTIDPEHHDERY